MPRHRCVTCGDPLAPCYNFTIRCRVRGGVLRNEYHEGVWNLPPPLLNCSVGCFKGFDTTKPPFSVVTKLLFSDEVTLRGQEHSSNHLGACP